MISRIRVIPLADAAGSKEHWGKSKLVVYLWAVVERLFVTNPWQISSSLRVSVLRLFGAKIGSGVIFRPRTRVTHPWNLRIGDNCWIGEGVWFHIQDLLTIGHDVVISQETFITCGSHSFRTDMSLETCSINIESGVWITSRCVVLGGSQIGKSALITPNSVVRGTLNAGQIYGTGPLNHYGSRF